MLATVQSCSASPAAKSVLSASTERAVVNATVARAAGLVATQAEVVLLSDAPPPCTKSHLKSMKRLRAIARTAVEADATSSAEVAAAQQR